MAPVSEAGFVFWLDIIKKSPHFSYEEKQIILLGNSYAYPSLKTKVNRYAAAYTAYAIRRGLPLPPN